MPAKQSYFCLQCGNSFVGIKFVGDDRVRNGKGKIIMVAYIAPRRDGRGIRGYRCKVRCN